MRLSNHDPHNIQSVGSRENDIVIQGFSAKDRLAVSYSVSVCNLTTALRRNRFARQEHEALLQVRLNWNEDTIGLNVHGSGPLPQNTKSQRPSSSEHSNFGVSPGESGWRVALSPASERGWTKGDRCTQAAVAITFLQLAYSVDQNKTFMHQ